MWRPKRTAKIGCPTRPLPRGVQRSVCKPMKALEMRLLLCVRGACLLRGPSGAALCVRPYPPPPPPIFCKNMKTWSLGYGVCEEYHSKGVRGCLPCHCFRCLALERPDALARSGGHDPSRLSSFLPSHSLRINGASRVNMPWLHGPSFSWLTIAFPTPLVFCKRCG